jgi:hypothetical protein
MGAVLVASVMGVPIRVSAQDASPALAGIELVHGPKCPCCARWATHLEAYGFRVTVREVPDVDVIQNEWGIPTPLRSCHSARVEGYIVEGHVPADIVARLLRERPAAAGIALPGMPKGSPGMEEGDTKEPYEVVTFDADGTTHSFAWR